MRRNLPKVKTLTTLRDELLASYQEGNILQTISAKWLEDEEERGPLSSELVSLHNEGLIDIVGTFELLKSNTPAGPDFFLTRHLFESILPSLEASTPAVMHCVISLYREAGQDGAAGFIFSSYIDFCTKTPDRPQEALNEIEKHADLYADLLPATISAGSRIDNPHYLAEAIRLSESSNIDLKIRAVNSIGRLHWPEGHKPPDAAFSCLERNAETEVNDQVLASTIDSTYAILQKDHTKEKRAVQTIAKALSKGGEYALHAASNLFGFHTPDLPNSLLDVLLAHLMRVKPANRGTVNNLDYGISRLLIGEDLEKAIRFLENYLVAHCDELKFEYFNSVSIKIRKNDDLIGKILTRWFLRGERILCDSIHSILNSHGEAAREVEIDLKELKPADRIHMVFVARKAVGYLFLQPVIAASILLSLMRHAPDEETVIEIGELLYYPLLISFPAQLREYLAEQATKESGNIRSSLDSALEKINSYLKTLLDVGDLPALHPSAAQREAYHRYLSRMMAESFKAARAQSVFSGLIAESVLLYGKKSINYIYDSTGESKRMEIPLTSHSTEVEIPRLEHLDPYGLDYILRVFKAEQIMR